MLTVLINVILSLAVGCGLYFTDSARGGWAIFWGVTTLVVTQLVAGFLVQRLVKREMALVEGKLKEGQHRLQQKVQRWQVRPVSSVKQAQAELEQDQRAFVMEALEASRGLEAYRWWSPLMGRQIATLRLQLNWMLKKFDVVDQLMDKAMFLEPAMVAMKLTRLYQLGKHDELDKAFKRHTRSLRYGQGAIIYGFYSWALVQEKRYDEALKVLVQATEKMENTVLKANREHLANNRFAQFTNSGLGEEWFMLHLEQPRIRTQRQRPQGFGRF